MRHLLKGTLIPSQELETFRQWFPVWIEEENNSPVIWWRFLGDQRFTQPFFEDSILRSPIRPPLICKTTGEFPESFNRITSLKPSAFIFHISRCGSTLLTQLLTASHQCIVISEAPAIDSSLQLCVHQTDGIKDQPIEIFKGVVSALGQVRHQDERHLFIKLDSWHINHLPIIRRTFPDTPLFFIYRNPIEIFFSHQRQRGAQMVPGLISPEMSSIVPEPQDILDLDAYCLKTLTRFFLSAREAADSGELILINYNQLPELAWNQFAQFFSMELDEQELESMWKRSTWHSKHPAGRFSEPKRLDKIDSSYDKKLDELNGIYREMEEMRLRQFPWRIHKENGCPTVISSTPF